MLDENHKLLTKNERKSYTNRARTLLRVGISLLKFKSDDLGALSAFFVPFLWRVVWERFGAPLSDLSGKANSVHPAAHRFLSLAAADFYVVQGSIVSVSFCAICKEDLCVSI